MGEGIEEVLVAGIFRHELEHVVQNLHWRPYRFNLFDFDGVVDAVLKRALRNAGSLYNAKPMEQDANAAASRYLRSRFDDTLLHDVFRGQRFAELVRWRAGPQPVETLVARTLAYCLMLRPEIAEWERAHGRDFTRELESYIPGASGLWSRLVELVENWAPADDRRR
jgi:hypothetical protein